jgi:hypothetical protein
MSGIDFKCLFHSEYTAKFNPYSRKIFSKLNRCHTASMGVHTFRCIDINCGHLHYQYHSCGDRHCPNCGEMKRDEWVENQMHDLLPTSYYHVVFTLPSELRSLVLGNRKIMYDLLFDASSETLLTIAKDSTYLGGTPGITSVLHTWGQDLSFHPHIHCIVSGGGIDKDENWISEKRKNRKFLYPKAVMQKVYKGIFMKNLRHLYLKNKLKIAECTDWNQLLSTIGAKDWNVYAKAPFGGPEQVVSYLGKYTHKIAITRHRITALSEDSISFRYRDYQDGNQTKEMTLSHQEFVRRFELHILPKRFIKIRHYGYLQNYKKKERIDRIYRKMGLPRRSAIVKVPVHIRLLEKTGRDIRRCPLCQKSKLELLKTRREPVPAMESKPKLSQYYKNLSHEPP